MSINLFSGNVSGTLNLSWLEDRYKQLKFTYDRWREYSIKNGVDIGPLKRELDMIKAQTLKARRQHGVV